MLWSPLRKPTLPRLRESAGTDGGTPAAAAVGVPATTPGSGGQVLVVDDEPEIAELVADTLRGAGLRAETVTSGRQALARLERGGIDLLVCDLRMPDLDGAALARALRDRYPRLASRLVLMTGDALRAGTGEVAAVTTGVPVLEKPLDLAALRSLVRRMLDGGAAGDG